MNINAGDTAWVMLSAALVFFMLPGLALFYGGLVRTKNVVATMVQCLVALGVISVLWVAVGYTLVFGDHGGFVGGLGHDRRPLITVASRVPTRIRGAGRSIPAEVRDGLPIIPRGLTRKGVVSRPLKGQLRPFQR
jgi:ammonia channel protein AmtB